MITASLICNIRFLGSLDYSVQIILCRIHTGHHVLLLGTVSREKIDSKDRNNGPNGLHVLGILETGAVILYGLQSDKKPRKIILLGFIASFIELKSFTNEAGLQTDIINGPPTRVTALRIVSFENLTVAADNCFQHSSRAPSPIPVPLRLRAPNIEGIILSDCWWMCATNLVLLFITTNQQP